MVEVDTDTLEKYDDSIFEVEMGRIKMCWFKKGWSKEDEDKTCRRKESTLHCEVILRILQNIIKGSVMRLMIQANIYEVLRLYESFLPCDCGQYHSVI